MRPPVSLLASALCLAASINLSADVIPAPYFRDGAVLQREKNVPVWGRADAGEKISVTFAGQTLSTVAEPDGRWRVDLAPLIASASPSELVISGKNTIRVRDVLVGEVWLCSGQSNMAWTVKNSGDAEREIAAADHPLIRHYKVALAASATQQDDARGGWETCTPATVGSFSATAYYFGREIQRELGVPVGLLNISYGGTPVESWMSPAMLASDPAFSTVFDRLKQDQARYPARLKLYETRLAAWQDERDAAAAAGKAFAKRAPLKPTGPDEVNRFTPSSLHHAMLHPFIPAAVRGVNWFQGEANVYRPDEYAALFSVMIRGWRAEFGQGDLPFHFVQMANQARPSEGTGVLLAHLRDAQARALALPSTGMAVSADIGDADNSHFKNKQEVGRRLALIALARAYGRAVEYSGPAVRTIAREDATIRVTFDHADGLRLVGDAPDSFQVAGDDRRFHPASVRIAGDSVIATSTAVPAPVAVRYAWHNNPAMTLRNAAGLPASPFRSDDWAAPQPARGSVQSDADTE